ncbi:MAG: hypothetical protein ACE37B_03265 [Ilumatobacter sp.]|uniref:hypothetical protein n=1 Tax=Ilumatobacter sp. TaxID=1967498 RepID=UPI003919E4C2
MRPGSTTCRVAGIVATLALLGACGSDPTANDSGAGTTAVDTNTPVSTIAPVLETAETDETDEIDETGAAEQQFPDVVDASATFDGATWTIAATVSSPYDTPERYADAWRVIGPDGTVYGERILTHDHADEQPFTRSQSGIEIPADVDEVVIEGRDQANGWGGSTFVLALPR